MVGMRISFKVLPNSRYQLGRHLHHRLTWLCKHCFVFRHCFIFRVRFVMCEDSAYALFIPPWWQSVLFHLFPPRQRRRNTLFITVNATIPESLLAGNARLLSGLL